jgi:CHAT domain-containing protein/tetratricopeptide (TPR) repeat protein
MWWTLLAAVGWASPEADAVVARADAIGTADLVAAEAAWRAAVEATRADADPCATAEARLGLAEVLTRKRARAQAIDEALRAEADAVACGGRAHDAHRAAKLAADGLVKAVRYEEAEAAYRRALDHGAAAGLTPLELSKTRNNLAFTLDVVGRYGEARAIWEEVVAIREADPNAPTPDLADAWNNLGFVAMHQGDTVTGRTATERAIALRVALGGPDADDVAQSLNNLAGVVKDEGDLHAARALYEQALAIWTRTRAPDDAEIGTVWHNLGRLAKDIGDFEGAKAAYDRALAIRERALGPNHPLVAQSLSNLATLHQWMDDDETSEALHRRALAIKEQVYDADHPSLATTLGHLSSLALSRGDLEPARALAERGLAINRAALGEDHPRRAYDLVRLADVVGEQGDLGAKEALLREALALRERALDPDDAAIVRNLVHLARVVADRGGDDEARALLDRALAIADRRLPLVDGLAEREALAHITAARATVDAWLGAHDRPGDERAAWGAALRWKGAVTRRLRARLAEERAADGEQAATWRALADLRRERATLELSERTDANRAAITARLVELTRAQERLERALAEVDASWRGEVARTSARPEDVCAALPSGAVLVDFVRYDPWAEPRYAAFVVRPSCEVRRVELGRADHVDALLAAWRDVLGRRDALAWRVDGRGADFAAAIWAPLAEAVGDASLILVVPDGALAAAPFAGLPLGDGSYLVERATVVGLADALDLLQPTEPTGAGAYAVGAVAFGAGPGPTCASAPFVPLPGTGEEIEGVASAWAARGPRRAGVTTRAGAAATEDRVRAELPGHALVHLATHAYVSAGGCRRFGVVGDEVIGTDPMVLSGLALARANAGGPSESDGVLTARELVSVDLRGTAVVVLSACETGLGVLATGEGMQGLRSATTLAGADQVVSALWPVDDRATTELMGRFYHHLFRRRAIGDAAGALRQAQLDMLAAQRAVGQRQPQIWSAFAVTGVVDPRTPP